MTERDISEEMLLEVIDSGDTRYKDAAHLWAFKEFPERHETCYAPCWCWKTG